MSSLVEFRAARDLPGFMSAPHSINGDPTADAFSACARPYTDLVNVDQFVRELLAVSGRRTVQPLVGRSVPLIETTKVKSVATEYSGMLGDVSLCHFRVSG
jgi:hypothetical protein